MNHRAESDPRHLTLVSDDGVVRPARSAAPHSAEPGSAEPGSAEPGSAQPTGAAASSSEPVQSTDPEVNAEQQALDQMYQRLADMRADAVRRKDESRFSSDGTPAGRFTRDALQYRYAEEIAMLTAAEAKLCFGRLDVDSGDYLHIGRLGLNDGTSDRRQILLDWRAPASAPFYTATAMTPQGVLRRRHLQTRGKRVLSVADEYLQANPDADILSDQLGAAGDSALLAALNAPRTGRMQDIIATIQAEQDRIIRSDRSGVLVVQGGPGTGKTVVALHRAAYLLYTHRERLGGHGVLVIGPNSTFLDYIGQVLPSLGESSVVLATVGTLFPGVRATEVDPPEAAELKGRPLMAKILDNAVLKFQAMPRATRTFTYDRITLRLERGLLAKAQRRAWASRLPHNRARQVFLRVVLDGLARQLAGRPGVKQHDDAPKEDFSTIRKELTAAPEVVDALADLWPAITPEHLLGQLLSDGDLLEFAAGRSLTPRQRKMLLRKRSQQWTTGDVPLLDELAELLGEVGTADRAWSAQREQELRYAQESLDALDAIAAGQEDAGIGFTVGMLTAEHLADLNTEENVSTTADRAAADREWTYGHVIVDEAQELSAMAWRMVMRRCPVKSLTIVGDVAQTSDPAGNTNWGKALRPHVGDRWRMEELTVNYRTPAEIMEVAGGVLAQIDPQLSPPRSVRESGQPPVFVSTSAGELIDVIVAQVIAETTEHADGQLAVVVPDDRATELLTAVREHLPDVSADAGPGHRVILMTVRQAKGLEFDAVLLVEPAEIAAQSSRGLGDLYVGATRSTQRLTIVHSKPLPTGMTAVDGVTWHPTPR